MPTLITWASFPFNISLFLFVDVLSTEQEVSRRGVQERVGDQNTRELQVESQGT